MAKKYVPWDNSSKKRYGGVEDYRRKNKGKDFDKYYISDIIKGYTHIYKKKTNEIAFRVCDNTEVKIKNVKEREKEELKKMPESKLCEDCLEDLS